MASTHATVATRAAGAFLALSVPLLALMPAAAAQQQEVTLTYTLETTGDCSGLTLAGEAGDPDSEFVATKLTDPDGDGQFTGTYEVNTGSEQVVRFEVFFADLAQDQLTNDALAELDVDARVIDDIGTVTLDADRTVEASYACGGSLPDTGGAADDAGKPLAAGAAGLAALAAGGSLLLRRRQATS